MAPTRHTLLKELPNAAVKRHTRTLQVFLYPLRPSKYVKYMHDGMPIITYLTPSLQLYLRPWDTQPTCYKNLFYSYSSNYASTTYHSACTTKSKTRAHTQTPAGQFVSYQISCQNILVRKTPSGFIITARGFASINDTVKLSGKARRQDLSPP